MVIKLVSQAFLPAELSPQPMSGHISALVLAPSLLLKIASYFTVHIHIFFFYSFVDWSLDYFHLCTIKNGATGDIDL